RIAELDLTLTELQADLRLDRRRRPVARRAPRHDVGDVGLGAVEPDRREHAVEQLSGASDERQSLLVLFGAGRLADQHQFRARRAVSEDETAGRGFQAAAIEAVEDGAQLFEARSAS